MSYAAAASKGPQQSAEEKRAPPPPQINPTDSPSTASLIDVDTPSVHTVSSDFSSQPVKTETQYNRLEREAQALEDQAREVTHKLVDEEKKAAAKARKGFRGLEANGDNPVVIGNAIAVVALSAGLGFGAYRKYVAGELTWKVAGAWTGVVGLFVAADYYLSSYLFKSKYPAKK